MFAVDENDVGEHIKYDYHQSGIDPNEFEKVKLLYKDDYSSQEMEAKYYKQDNLSEIIENNSEYELNDNEISLDMYSKELDTISLSRGVVENIWYVELESQGQIIWSSVITYDFFKHENKIWESFVSKNNWNKKLFFGNDINIITKNHLYELLIQDGITNESTLKLFTSIGLWKSLFLTLNYSTYIRRKREILYSNQVRNYIIKFNKRKETIERRMKMSDFDEEERNSLIKLIYQGIQNLFTTVNNSAGQTVFKITYKNPFYWASLISNIYIFEKLGIYELMLIIMEYVSEVIPELIFEFTKYSSAILTDNNIIEMLETFNNQLLQNTSTCFQEYLSDLLSITHKSTFLLSNYVHHNENEKQQISIQIDQSQTNKLQDNNQDLKREPNYMKPTRLSEIRRQNSKRTMINDQVHPKHDDENVCKDNQLKVNHKQDQEKNPANFQDKKSNVGVFARRRRSSSSVTSKVGNPNSTNENNLSQDSMEINTNNSPINNNFNENDNITNEKNNLNAILNILKEKSKSQTVNKVNFDDELFNIINELDQLDLNTSDNFNTKVENQKDKELEKQESPVNGDGFINDNIINNNNLNNSESHLQVKSSKSSLDPYDWYCSSSNNENDDFQIIQDGAGNMNKIGPIEDDFNNEKFTTLISLNDNKNHIIKNMEFEENTSSNIEFNELKYIESILDKEIEELQKKEDELASDIFF